jgi:hypothetical protein
MTRTAERGWVSIDGEQYVPRRIADDLQAERDRLAEEVDRLRAALAAERGEQDGATEDV